MVVEGRGAGRRQGGQGGGEVLQVVHQRPCGALPTVRSQASSLVMMSLLIQVGHSGLQMVLGFSQERMNPWSNLWSNHRVILYG